MEIVINDMTLDDIEMLKVDFSQNFDEFWSINILEDDFKTTNSSYIVAKIDNKIVGFAGSKILIDEADIMNIVTHKKYRNFGIGKLLLEKLIEIAQKTNCKTLTLEVNEHNTIAIHLYEKYHFVRIGLRKKYYNNTDNAIIMQKNIR